MILVDSSDIGGKPGQSQQPPWLRLAPGSEVVPKGATGAQNAPKALCGDEGLDLGYLGYLGHL